MINQYSQSGDFNVIVLSSGNKPEKEKYKRGTTIERLMRKCPVPIWVVKNIPVKPVRRILCPVYFSDESKRALVNAVLLADKFDALLYIVHIFTPVTAFSHRFSIDYEAENKLLRAGQQSQFNTFLESIDPGNVKYKTQLLAGEPHSEILNFIESENIDLLLMGTTGKSGLSRILVGSVTEKVTRELPCSYITTKSIDISTGAFDKNLEELIATIQLAIKFEKSGDPERAIEKLTEGIKQFPDKLPILCSLIQLCESTGKNQMAEFYRNYARFVIEKVWGEQYLDRISIP
jgi:nucleotide-binding universal stress UspA family protein